jgi:Tol biopolymer transport system component
VICAVQRNVGYTGTWSTQGYILFSAIQGDAIQRVSASGGTPERAFVANRASGERRIGWPWFLPDGRSVLYMVQQEGQPAIGRLMLARSGGSTVPVADLSTEAQYADPGYLVYGRRGTLLAQRFDPASGQLSGEPVPLASNVQTFPSSGWAAFSVARNGTLAFLTAEGDARLTWIEPTGRATSSIGAPGNYLDLNTVPDGRSVLATRLDNATGVYDMWSIDGARGTETRLSSGPSTNVSPFLLADRPVLIYSKAMGGPPQLQERDTVSGKETPLSPSGGFQAAISITRDGATLIYVQRHERGDWDILTMPLRGAHTPSPLIATTADEGAGRLSPDDRVFAFVSDETGHPEIYVTPFPSAATKIRLSTAGGRMPRWADAHRLLFLADDGRVMRTDVSFDGRLQAATPAPAFPQPLKVPWRDFLAFPDRRLLAIVPEARAGEPPLTVITHAVR